MDRPSQPPGAVDRLLQAHPAGRRSKAAVFLYHQKKSLVLAAERLVRTGGAIGKLGLSSPQERRKRAQTPSVSLFQRINDNPGPIASDQTYQIHSCSTC